MERIAISATYRFLSFVEATCLQEISTKCSALGVTQSDIKITISVVLHKFENELKISRPQRRRLFIEKHKTQYRLRRSPLRRHGFKPDSQAFHHPEKIICNTGFQPGVDTRTFAP